MSDNTAPITFDVATGQIVDPSPGDLYVHVSDHDIVTYAVAAKVIGSDPVAVTLALAGINGLEKSEVVTNESPRGWKRAIDQTAPIGSLHHFVKGFVPRATEIDSLREANFARALRAERELDEFKENVKSVALEYGQRYDLCEKLAEALSELGIELNVTVEVTGTFTVTMEVPWGEHDSIDESDVLDAVANYGSVDFDTEIVSE